MKDSELEVSPSSSDEGLKVCTKCGLEKPLSDFWSSKNTKDGKYPSCKKCASAAKKTPSAVAKRQATRRTPESKERQWINNLKSRFSITPERYYKMLKEQEGGCAICGMKPRKTRLAVDHDHACCPGDKSCGKCVRGLLCRQCNYKLLGRICQEGKNKEKAIQMLSRALSYVRDFEPHV